MQALREDDFKKMARDVVTEYLGKKTPLSESLVKMSEDMGLNPDQIQNLVQLANSLAHLTLFDNKDGDDKIIEFSPADPESVLKSVYKENPMPESQEACEMESPVSRETDFYGDFPDLASKLKSISSGGIEEKVASIMPEADEQEPAAGMSPRQQSMAIIKVRKVASELKDKELASAMEYSEELDKLATEFAKLYGPDFNEFEKTALAFRGEMAVPVLSDIRSCLRMADTTENISFEKKACVVDADTKEIKSLDRLIKLSEDHKDYARAYNHLQQKVGGAL